MGHEFGHHPMETLVQHGLPEHRRGIVNTLRRDLWDYAMDRSATYVIKSCLKHCEKEDQMQLVVGLLERGRSGFVCLQNSQWGVHILMALQHYVEKESWTPSGSELDPEMTHELFHTAYPPGLDHRYYSTYLFDSACSANV